MNEWDTLDSAAKANLEPNGLKAFFEYKELLRDSGCKWEFDAEDTLRGFIWDELETQ